MLAWWWRVLVLLKRTPSPMNPTGMEEGIAKEKTSSCAKNWFQVYYIIIPTRRSDQHTSDPPPRLWSNALSEIGRAIFYSRTLRISLFISFFVLNGDPFRKTIPRLFKAVAFGLRHAEAIATPVR